MFEDLLPQTCQIIKLVKVQDEWSPEKEEEEIVLDRVPCRLDSTIAVRGITPLSVADQFNIPNRIGGLMFVGGYYGTGSNRKFNEQHLIKLEGFTWYILAVHDVFAADDLHHYELEIYRGVNR
jgi:hypothetical protein